MNIADRIQYLRKQKGYSQEELADKVGVSRQAVSKWESEQSTPDLEKVIAMSELFEVTTDYILKGIEPVSTTNRKTVKTLYLWLTRRRNSLSLRKIAELKYRSEGRPQILMS